MSLKSVGYGDNTPSSMNVVIEIPEGGEPVKYEVCKETGAMIVDRFMSTAMFYPCHYGYVPKTLSEDGDPVDVLVLAPAKLMTGVVIECRPVGMLRMTDEAGADNKLLAVPVDSLCKDYVDVKTVNDLPKTLLNKIEHFFEHYKDLESSKWVKIDGWADVDAAYAEVQSSIQRYV